MMKKFKRVFSLFLAILMVASMPLSASAASISSNKKKATKICGGQTIYVTTNNTIFSKTGFATDIEIYMSKTANGGIYEYFTKPVSNARIKVVVYKKSGGKWQTYKSYTNLAINKTNGKITSVKLPGQGVQYKIVVSPNYHSGCSVDILKQQFGVSSKSASALNGFWVELDYGKITKVA